MTVLTKPSWNVMKPDEIKSPLVLDVEEGGDRDLLPPPHKPAKRSTCSLLCLSIVAVLVAAMGVWCGRMLYLYVQDRLGYSTHPYIAYCAVPYDINDEDVPMLDRMIDPNMGQLMPLRWLPNPAAQILDTGKNGLQEEFDIRGQVERIKVFNDGRQVSFVHDFEGNTSGIIDDERCFMMPLDPNLVLTPDALLLNIEQEQQFDVQRIQSTLRAIIPALNDMARRAFAFAECHNKPTYKLEKEDGAIIRKRSADQPSHDYVQFAGQKVQEIKISNMDALKQYERANAQ